MNHLTNEQFEDILTGAAPTSPHLDDCDVCRRRLAEKQAVADRLRGAFAGVKPDPSLADTIRRRITESEPAARRIRYKKTAWNIGFRKAVWPAAAAMLLLAVFIGIESLNPPAAMAAPAELVRIHEHNLSGHDAFYNESDPEKLAGYFKDNLGFSPSFPALGRGMEIRGCCVQHFQEKIVGSYVVDTPDGVMSVIVVTDKPQTLGMSAAFDVEGKTFYKSRFAHCNLVALRLGDFTYCAVGDISADYLTDLLVQLMANPANETSGTPAPAAAAY